MTNLCSQPPKHTSHRNAFGKFREGDPQTQPFRTVEEAWFWTIAALTARRDGANHRAKIGKVSRPCEPDDILKCLDGLYRRTRVDLVHARILRVWGERQVAPSSAHPLEKPDACLWREAMSALEWPLRAKGIIL